MGIPISPGSLFNFNKEAYERLDHFESFVKQQLISTSILHVDETGINVNSKLHWIHITTSPLWAHFYIHESRGTKAMNEEGVIPSFRGVLVHDHLKSYYTFTHCKHALCNAHHVRELQAVIELNGHTWAKNMQSLLKEINEVTLQNHGKLAIHQVKDFLKRYNEIIKEGEVESPPPAVGLGKKKKRGRVAKEKHRNLLERLRDYKKDVLRFMMRTDVPFTNNMAENDLRMIKVQQKISGCFRAIEGAKIFCRVRSYLLSAQKHNVNPTEALFTLFDGKKQTFYEQNNLTSE